MKRLLLISVMLTLAAAAYASPSFKDVKDSYRKSDAVLLDRHGKVIHELRVDPERRRLDWVRIKEMSPSFLKAVIESEDKRFYAHHGVDWKAAVAASVKNLFIKTPRGASTITMQLASILDKKLKPAFSRRSLGQKWDQMQAARDVEKTWSKEEILEAYLNLITFRGELQGISAASRGLFDKEPFGLNEEESLVLASLIRGPSASPEAAAKRACRLRDPMKAAPSCEDITRLAQKVLSAPYSVRQKVLLAPNVALLLLKDGKSSVISTLDGGLQRYARDVLRHQLLAVRSQNVRDGAVLVVENRTGDILAYVGSSGEGSSAQYVDGVQARRQAGSTLKPFLYAEVFDKKILTPGSIVNDSPTDIPTTGGIYKPENYENDFKGMVSARTSLASSLNIPAVKALSLLGVEPFVQKLRTLGFALPGYGDFYGPSLALGSADVSLYELVNAYRTLANNGVHREMRIAFERKGGPARSLFSREAAFLVTNILSDREARSVTFSLENPLATRFWSAVKTGTSKDMRDNWCIGYSQEYTVGVWVGNFSGRSMWNVSGVTGAAPVWLEIMNYLHGHKTSVPPIPPSGVVARKIAFGDTAEAERVEWFLMGTEPPAAAPGKPALQVVGYAPSPMILYPVSGEIIALDPDIPEDRQLVFFEARQGRIPLRWILNGRVMGDTSQILSWKPESGHYTLSLIDADNEVVDSVVYQVRGN